MAKTNLTAERLREILNYNPETGVFTWISKPSKNRCRGDVAGGIRDGRYLVITVGGAKIYAHRLAWFMSYGVWPKNIDHINRVKTDNRLSNLREALPFENMQNFTNSRKTKSGVVGVFSYGKKWAARIGYKGRQIHLGTFESVCEARNAYINAKFEIHTFCPVIS